MSELLVQALKLPVHKLNTLIEAEASGGGIIPYVGYVEARLAILELKKWIRIHCLWFLMIAHVPVGS